MSSKECTGDQSRYCLSPDIPNMVHLHPRHHRWWWKMSPQTPCIILSILQAWRVSWEMTFGFVVSFYWPKLISHNKHKAFQLSAFHRLLVLLLLYKMWIFKSFSEITFSSDPTSLEIQYLVIITFLSVWKIGTCI